MALTKTDITKALGEETGFPLKRSTAIIESLLEIMKRSLESGEDVLISGFGKFTVQDKKRTARPESGHGGGHDAPGSADRYLQKLREPAQEAQREMMIKPSTCPYIMVMEHTIRVVE